MDIKEPMMTVIVDTAKPKITLKSEQTNEKGIVKPTPADFSGWSRR